LPLYELDYKHRGAPEVVTSKIAYATAVDAWRHFNDLEASDAEVVAIRKDGREIFCGELRNEAENEARKVRRT
jgi:hypothetical protein